MRRSSMAVHEKRKWIASIYNKELNNVEEIRLPVYDDAHMHSRHLYIVELDSKRFSRDKFINKLYEKGIGTSVHFIPLHIHPYYKKKYGFTPEDFPVARECYKRAISLPIYTKLPDEDVFRIINTIKNLLS